MPCTSTRSSVQQHAAPLLRTGLGRQDCGPAGAVRVFLHVLFTAPARMGSLAAAGRALATAPSRATVRRATRRAAQSRADLLRARNRAPAAGVPRGLRRRPPQVALDLGNIGGPEAKKAVPKLDELAANDPSKEVKNNAAAALKKLK